MPHSTTGVVWEFARHVLFLFALSLSPVSALLPTTGRFLQRSTASRASTKAVDATSISARFVTLEQQVLELQNQLSQTESSAVRQQFGEHRTSSDGSISANESLNSSSSSSFSNYDFAQNSTQLLREEILSTQTKLHNLNTTSFASKLQIETLQSTLADADSKHRENGQFLAGDLETARKLANETKVLSQQMKKELAKEHLDSVQASKKVVSMLADPGSEVGVEKFESRLGAGEEKFRKALEMIKDRVREVLLLDSMAEKGKAEKGPFRTGVDRVRTEIRKLVRKSGEVGGDVEMELGGVVEG